ncbi:TrbL/VirB6 family protein [Candidatus Trichorickettsia mobilis]|uniref:type IV secretion system protein n=1 Tax=Candidatus Trichorickettsia mobilis TaxID=1346319 RepID=UPI00292DC3F8|nr:type IV secretion system protein [Candidatus Trichorickettsia mobilis]
MAVSCLKETLDKVFFQYNTCKPGTKVTLTSLSPFATFQEALKTSIRAALIIYVIFYGFKVVLNHEYANLDKVAMFILKFLFISYFAVGLGPAFFKEGKLTTKNGMVEFALPFLTSATSDFAYIVFSSGGSKGLCEFDQSKYEKGYKYFALWDAIDCRIGYYLGMQLLYNMSTVLDSLSGSNSSSGDSGNAIQLGSSGKDGTKALKTVGGLTFFAVMFGFFMAGNIIIVICGLVFVIIFTSIMLQFITSYLVCLITLYVMAYISPIFITMALFERTKSYFDSWLKVTLSCALQPAVLAGFVALLLTMYDSAIYKNCQFKRHDYTVSGVNFSTFELREPAGNPTECRDSAGYKLLKHYIGQGWEKYNVILFPIYSIRDIFGLLVNMVYVFVFTYIFYHFSKSFSQFAADITGGPIMDSVTASPQKVVDTAIKAANFIKNAVKASQGDPQAAKELAESAKKDDKKEGSGSGEGGGEGGGGGAEEASDKIGGGSGGGGGGGA